MKEPDVAIARPPLDGPAQNGGDRSTLVRRALPDTIDGRQVLEEVAASANRVYTTKTEQEVSWFEPLPAISLEKLEAAG